MKLVSVSLRQSIPDVSVQKQASTSGLTVRMIALSSNLLMIRFRRPQIVRQFSPFRYDGEEQRNEYPRKPSLGGGVLG